MVEPVPFDVTIYIDGVDVTAFVPYESMTFTDNARQVSTFDFTIVNPPGVTPARMMQVYMTANSLADEPIVFLGFVMELVSKKRDNGIVKIYECRCADRKILLQRSVIGMNEFLGADFEILSDLFTATYPDLSDLFDFASDVTPFADNVDYAVEDGTNLLDAINRLADILGAFPRWKNQEGQSTQTITVDFDGGYSDFTTSHNVFSASSTTGNGNPDNGFSASQTFGSQPGSAFIQIVINLPETVELTNLTLDGFGHRSTSASVLVYIDYENDTNIDFGGIISSGGAAGAWKTYNVIDQSEFLSILFEDATLPIMTNAVRILMISAESGAATMDFRFDNIVLEYTGSGGVGKTSLQWDDEPDLSDFDIDVQVGDEFAFNIDLYEGDFGDFNSVTVIGGYEEVAIDTALDSDGVQKHIGLPYPVTDLTVYTNTGTDTTPTWGSALVLGAWGSDVLTGDGGDKAVLYDAANHVLLFNAAPPNMVNSYRVTGKIKRPIRIRVENAADDELILATTYTDEKITSLDEAVAIATAQLNQRNSIKHLNFSTYEPGLQAGQQITVTDSARGLSESLIIQRISCKWLGGGGQAQFEVECGDKEDVSLDTIIANVDRRSRLLSSNVSPNTQTAYLYTDDSGEFMTDDSGQQLYEVV